MSPEEVILPTLESLKVTPESIKDVDPARASKIAENWVSEFNNALNGKKSAQILALFQPDAFWRDMLSLTWDFRTFHEQSNIEKLLTDRVLSGVSGFGNVKVHYGEGMSPVLQQPFPDLAWVQIFISFAVSGGTGSGIVRLVPVSTKSPNGLNWKAHVILTTLASLTNHEEKLGPLRDPNPVHGLWPAKREQEVDYLDREPAVVIIGAGQSGLDVAARLKCLGVETLVMERNDEVGKQWKNRYEALCLHDPVWYDHMPYIPFPTTWPVYSPAPKLAQWLKSYAESMELNIWTSTIVHSASYDEKSKSWTVKVTRAGAGNPKAYGERVVTARHLVFALGLASGVPNMPEVKGHDIFKGKIVHSTEHDTAKKWVGKKALVVGACTSGHDIAHDFYTNGVDVTIYQRSSTYIMTTKNGWAVLFAGSYEEGGPPTEAADMMNACLPHKFGKLIQQRATAYIKELDKDLLQDLEKVGFKLNYGFDGSGFALLAWNRAGGYYLDVGASRLVADKKIKLVSGPQLSHFTEKCAVFDDGTEVECDIAVFATGFGDGRAPIQKIIGDKLGSQLKPIWGLDEEGEIKSVWRGTGVDRLHLMMGNLALCRFHSRHVALQIKAMEEGIWDGKRYGD